MSEVISRQAAIEAFEKFIHEIGIEDAPYNYGEIALCEANVPSAERVGKWIAKPSRWCTSDIVFQCSECGCNANMPTAFCPNCGARMDGEEE